MKKIALALLLAASAAVYAASETSSFRVNGDIVTVGDNIGSLMAKAGRPMSQYSYNVDTGGNTSVTVTDFIYTVGNEIYTVTTKQGKVTKIIWERR